MLRGATSHVRANVLPQAQARCASSSSLSTSSAPTRRLTALTQPQKNLYRALEQLTVPQPRSATEAANHRPHAAARKPEELLSYAKWFVAQSQCAAAGPADAKGKAKEMAPIPKSSLFDHSPSSWALLLRTAAHVGDGRAFVAILDAFARWKNEIGFVSEEEQDLNPAPPRASLTNSSNDDYTTIPRVEQLAASLVYTLRRRHHIGKEAGSHPVLQLPFITEGTQRLHAARYRDELRPEEIKTIFMEPLPIPENWAGLASPGGEAQVREQGTGFFSSSRPATSNDSQQGRQRRRRRPLITWLSTLNANQKVKRQIYDLMNVFRQAYEDRCVDEEVLRRRIRILQAGRGEDARYPGPSALNLQALGELDEQDSLLSVLVRREVLANAVVLNWLRGQNSSSETGPPAWLLHLALRSFAQRGDTQRIREVIAALLKEQQRRGTVVSGQESGLLAGEEDDQEPPQSLAADLFEEDQQQRDPSLESTSGAHSDSPCSPFSHKTDPKPLPPLLLKPRTLLNLLLRSHQLHALDARSGRRALASAWQDVRSLCSRPSTATPRGSASWWHPNETSVLLLLSLLKYDRQRVARGLGLVKKMDREWGRAGERMAEIERYAKRLRERSTPQEQEVGAAEAAEMRLRHSDIAPSRETRRRRRRAHRRLVRENAQTLKLTVRTARRLLRWTSQMGKEAGAEKAPPPSEEEAAHGGSVASIDAEQLSPQAETTPVAGAILPVEHGEVHKSQAKVEQTAVDGKTTAARTSSSRRSFASRATEILQLARSWRNADRQEQLLLASMRPKPSSTTSTSKLTAHTTPAISEICEQQGPPLSLGRHRPRPHESVIAYPLNPGPAHTVGLRGQRKERARFRRAVALLSRRREVGDAKQHGIDRSGG
ncbi:hypothetical protein BDZ90DRAFT_235020 [Jaminaea rosea]|uniref:Uncharacterized protein n=1 Tax=Jaminaea rosea TaxID=1569628 RepID=A0A316UKH9_9BASI|nr:hypothetical protein BDZ90DRAFT_235020 [Jaminaea rosea]PWN24473.1 hypothetical protein BDZ90DRAFT_235020 [Jaminaea rosea]